MLSTLFTLLSSFASGSLQLKETAAIEVSVRCCRSGRVLPNGQIVLLDGTMLWSLDIRMIFLKFANKCGFWRASGERTRHRYASDDAVPVTIESFVGTHSAGVHGGNRSVSCKDSSVNLEHGLYENDRFS